MDQQRIRIKFAKKGMMRFISHLDLMRLFQRASRRARLPVVISKGFNPHPRISIQPAVKLGVESYNLEAIFRIEGWIRLEEFKERLQDNLPEGIEILQVEAI